MKNTKPRDHYYTFGSRALLISILKSFFRTGNTTVITTGLVIFLFTCTLPEKVHLSSFLLLTGWSGLMFLPKKRCIENNVERIFDEVYLENEIQLIAKSIPYLYFKIRNSMIVAIYFIGIMFLATIVTYRFSPSLFAIAIFLIIGAVHFTLLGELSKDTLIDQSENIELGHYDYNPTKEKKRRNE